MRRRPLDGTWEFREVDGGRWLSGTVPGGVYSDLLEAGEIPDPFRDDNELDVQWVGETDWEYRRTVEVDPETLAEDRVLLCFDGLDTVATVLVNGETVGESRNMFVGHEFDVADALEPGENELRVRFRSPVEYGIERAEAYPHEVPAIRYPVDQPARNFVRKAGCHYGWDWGPCLPTVGIYRDVALLAHSDPRIEHVTTEQDHGEDADGDLELTVRVGVDAPAAGEYDLSASVAGATASQAVDLSAGESTHELRLDVADADLWWPHSHGDQPLYDLEVSVSTPEGVPAHRTTERLGFRDLETVVEPDDAGTGFRFEVNGTPVFAKGANTVPTSPFHGDVSRERYEHLIRSAADANMNTLRVWGGGYYEHEEFYELCDEYGLLVWQDFMFSCALYPADEAFLKSVEAEVRHQVRRLADHPSIALWCGNNENEEALYNWFADHEAHEGHVADYRRLYEETVAPTCRETDPSRTYWPGSPSSGPGAEDPYDFSRGDVHYWDVWHGGRPFEAYLDTEPRFVSEFGYQSFPSTDSLSTVLDEDQFNPTAPLMEHHQRNPGGNATILERMADSFRIPFDFGSFVYLSQVQHGLAMRTAIEHWRRRKPETMGALYWQLNVLWPVASWASIEYDGRWKAQQYMARRQFAPVLVSFAPGFEGEDSPGNAQAEDPDDPDRGDVESQTLWITSDVDTPLSGIVDCVVETFDGRVVHERSVEVELDAGESTELVTVDREDLPPGVDATEVFCRASFDGPAESYEAVAVFEPYKRLDLPDADVTATVDGTEVTVEADGAALFVELDVGRLSGSFSDAYFHLGAGERRTVSFDSYGGERTGVVEAELEERLAVCHLRDTY